MIIKLNERTKFGHPALPAISYHNLVTNDQWHLPGATITYIGETTLKPVNGESLVGIGSELHQHAQGEYELILMQEGEITYTDGDGNVTVIGPGDVALLSPGDTHSCKCATPDGYKTMNIILRFNQP